MKKRFSNVIESEKIYFKHAKGKTIRSGAERHPVNEIILFLGGEAEFKTEQVTTELRPNTVLVIPKETYHQLTVLGEPTDYHRCVFNFDHPAAENLMKERFSEPTLLECTDSLRYLFGVLMQRAAEREGLVPDAELLRSTLMLILHELAQNGRVFESHDRLSKPTRKAIAYIEKNLHRPVSVGELAKVCNISPSSMSHIFKQEMHVSVYKYVLQKRLMLAADKISQGQPATVTAMELGFGDYSGFYRQYKKTFGISPSGKYKNRSS